MTRKLIAGNKYDVIVSYFMDYDDYSHKHGSWSKEAEDALETAVDLLQILKYTGQPIIVQ